MGVDCNIMPSLVASACPNWLVNQGSWLLIILEGRPNHCTTLLKYNWATPGPVIAVWQERNMAALEHPWLMIVRIVLCPLCLGNPVIKSMITVWKGRVPSLVGI